MGFRVFLGNSQDIVFEILSQISGAYLVMDCVDKTEKLSPTLCSLLEIKTKNPNFSDISEVISKDEFLELQRNISVLTNEHKNFQNIKVLTKNNALSCSGEIITVSKRKYILLRFTDITEKEKSNGKKIAFDKSPLPIWIRNNNFKVIESNDAFEKINANTNNFELAKKSHTENEIRTESREISVGDEERLFKIIEVPTESGTVGFAIDITKKNEVKKKLDFSISLQKQFLETSASAVAIYGADTKLMYYNVTFASLWNLDKEFLDKNPTYDSILEKQREKRLLPEQTDFQEFKIDQLKLFSNLTDMDEEFLYCPNGKTIRRMIMPHNNGGLICTFDDVSDKMALEISYNTLMAVQKETLDNLQEGVAFFGENGLLKLFNPAFAAMLGFNKNTLDLNPHFSEILESVRNFSPEWKEYKEHLTRILSSRRATHEIIEWVDHKVISLNTIPLPDGGLLCSFADITDSMIVERTLREKNRALEQADKLKTDFLENISYELRSPLTSIMGFAEALKYSYFGELNAKQSEYVGHICSASETLKDLIDMILFLASIEAGYVELNINNVDISSMLNEMVSKRKNELIAKEISVEIVLSEELKTMVGDREHIQHALLQIFTNAIAFSPKGETIKIGAERKTIHDSDNVEENEIILWVKDNGVGVSAEEQKTFFDWFNKLDVGKAGISGVGIGLSLAKRIVILHGGRLLIESEKGKGTKVIFHIPQSVNVSEEKKQTLVTHDSKAILETASEEESL